MNTSSLTQILLAAAAGASIWSLGGAAMAEMTPTQKTDFDHANSFGGSGSGNVTPDPRLSATFDPFDPGLGTLVSFTLGWELGGEYRGMATADLAGDARVTMGGTLKINELAFDGTGTSANVAVGPAESFDESYMLPTYRRELLAAEAGVTYNPALLAVVTGDEDYTATFDNGSPNTGLVSVSYNNLASLDATLVGSATMTYTYEPAGQPGELRAVAFTFDLETRTSTVRWISDPAKRYAVDATADLVSWTEIAADIGATGEETEFVENDIPAAATRRLYRVRELD